MDQQKEPGPHLKNRAEPAEGGPASGRRRIQIFQHVPFEDIGCLLPWAEARGHALAYTRLYAGQSPPSPEAYDWLIVMGGPMGVHDEAKLPWLREEKRALEKALNTAKPVLGICLGAQLMADVLGARVSRNRHPEIGWFPIELGADARRTWLGQAFPPTFTAFHWHGDTFGIPAGAVPLGASAACDHQGFLLDDKALALQFHPEMTRAGLEDLIRECAGELRTSAYVQDAAALRAGADHIPETNAMMEKACGFLQAFA